MAIISEQTPSWDEIERAESYLVCCMYDDATSLASSILKRLLDNCYYESDWMDMVESSAMVLVQSLNQSQRTSEIVKKLKLLFGSLTAIPVQVFLTGVCFQMSESPSTSVQGYLEEFLNIWTYVDGRYYSLSGAEGSVSGTEGPRSRFSLGIDQYLEVVELYVITLLAITMKNTDLAMSWVEKAALPTEKRQELLRRLNSMNASRASSSPLTSVSSQLPHQYKSDHLRDTESYNRHHRDLESKYVSHEGNTSKEEILKLSRQRVSRFWWFPTISLKLGNTRFVVPSGKILLASLLLLMYYLTRKKQAALKRVLAEKVGSMKKALMDLWQLAFSYQVNPLAAVQTLPTATRSSH